MPQPLPRVVFVCVRNAGKSQMAAALARLEAGDRLQIESAGTQPGTKLNAESAHSVEEVGGSMAGESPKPADPDLLRSADRVILIGSEAQLPDDAGVAAERWLTVEPSQDGIEGMERMRLIRDDLQARVRTLVAELDQASAG